MKKILAATASPKNIKENKPIKRRFHNFNTYATYCVGSDRYPYKVLTVSPRGRKLVAQEMSFKIEYLSGSLTEQRAVVSDNPKGKLLTFYANAKGEYWLNDCQLVLGKAEAYRDPDF